MTQLRPFRGWHYNWDRYPGPDVICPPYDVIDRDHRDELLARSPYNAVRLILPGSDDDGARYERARSTLAQWKGDGVLVREEQPTFYIYRQTFRNDARDLTRTGFFAAVRLEQFETGSIYAHEETLTAPKEDRYRLLDATRTNLSPVFGLLDDPDGDLTTALREAPVIHSLQFEEGGIFHELAPLHDRAFHERLIGCSRARSLFIADGHHRYETALRYCRQNDCQDDPDDPRSSVLMFCVPTGDPGLLILPTHRVLDLSNAISVDELRNVLDDVVQFGDTIEGDSAADELHDALRREARPHTFAFLLDGSRKGVLGTWIGPDKDAVSIAGVQLDVLILHRTILPRLKQEGNLNVAYSHDLADVSRLIRQGDNRLGVLLAGTPLESMISVARKRTRLPAKTTFFYPKVPTALVFRTLDD